MNFNENYSASFEFYLKNKNMKKIFPSYINPLLKKIGSVVSLFFSLGFVPNAQVLDVGIAGLSHDHVWGIMQQYKRGEVNIIGIAEGDTALMHRYIKAFDLPDSIFFKNVVAMLNHIRPEVVLAYNPISEHLAVVEVCAPKGISVMVEKPLAVSYKQAERIAFFAKKYHIQVFTNYETTWYASNQQINEMVNHQNAIGLIRKIITHDGHYGPIEIGCTNFFTNWLTDPVKNGGGAVMDFGCYGANLMTWLMKGRAPIAVRAVTKRIKPAVYPKVDDDATIILEYPEATGIIEASWNWPYNIKDMEVYGTNGYLHALNGYTLQQRLTDKDSYREVDIKPYIYKNNLDYLADVLRGKVSPQDDLSSLSNNLVVMKILDAARESAKQGKRILFDMDATQKK
jgi:predicted dehydrogenase